MSDGTQKRFQMDRVTYARPCAKGLACTPPGGTAVKQALRNARQRWHEIPPSDRPALNHACNAVTLFAAEELEALAKASWWPLPARAVVWITKPRGGQTRSRVRRTVSREVTAFLAEHLPGAVEALVRRATRRG